MASAPSERLPSGFASGPPSGGQRAPQESPEARRQRGARALSLTARLLAGASTFFFLAYLFAYFYLRSLNVDHMWRPAHVKPDQGLGAAFIACVLLSVALAILADRRLRAGSSTWTAPVIGAVTLGLAAIALQCIEYTVQSFGPTDGAFASVFCTWTAFYLIAVLGTMYWLETQVATELRARGNATVVAAAAAEAAARSLTYEDPDELLPRGLDAAVFYWAFLGGIGVITYVTLYLL